MIKVFTTGGGKALYEYGLDLEVLLNDGWKIQRVDCSGECYFIYILEKLELKNRNQVSELVSIYNDENTNNR